MAAVFAPAFSASGRNDAPHSVAYRLSFPHINLGPDEQIESFTDTVPCGHIESIVGIPDDWNIEVQRAISAVEELHASAGHGASYLRQMTPFNGVIRIVSNEDDCFSVSSEITAAFDDERVIKLSRQELVLTKQ